MSNPQNQIFKLGDIDYNALSPMMQQYVDLKQAHKEYILFFRMGDFYEMFFEDANIASNILGVVLTKRLAGSSQEVPMCGVPLHSYETYLNRLIKHGYNVAICDQLETPEEAKKRGKSIVQRDIVRIITPGTITEEALLERDAYNYLVAIVNIGNKSCIAWIDISSGDFYLETLSKDDINTLLYKIKPKEILVSKDFDISLLLEELRLLVTKIPNENFSLSSCNNILNQFYENRSFALNSLAKIEKISCGVLLHYILLTQKDIINVAIPKKDYSSQYMRIDSFTLKSLEILSSYSGSKEGSLKHSIDFTQTSQGSRMLSNWLSKPLVDVNKINNRLEVVSFFIKNTGVISNLREVLKNTPDIERSLGKISLKKGSINEILAVRNFLRGVSKIHQLFFRSELPSLLLDIIKSMDIKTELLSRINNSIKEDININKDSSFIKKGFSTYFDEIFSQKDSILENILSMQEKYSLNTGIPRLKITYNNSLGYFIEVQSKYADKITNKDNFILKQTMSSVVRFSTEELMSLEVELSKVKHLSISLEKEILTDILDNIMKDYDSLKNSSKFLSYLDVLLSFAKVANDNNFVKPVIDDSYSFIVKGGRHIVVEKSLGKNSNDFFIPNDCIMSEHNIFLLTGPNMAGKSTYLRQNALIALMAQSGCFVPATFAHIGICDAIFSRVGASDDLFRGQSTFMVEMLELSIILNNATNRSFLILDEIGRGTSTYDGLSIAWSSLDYISSINSRTIFATHYHELKELEKSINKVGCYYVNVVEESDKITFMHSVIRGSINKSYGVEVAKIAGLPNSVIKKARTILSSLEGSTKVELPLWSTSISNKEDQSHNLNSQEHLVIESLQDVDLNSISPLDAINLIHDLKSMLKNTQKEK